MEETRQLLPFEKDLLEYVRECCMENGSYCSWRYREWGLPSTRDTFWALRIHGKLFRNPPAADRTRRWLESELPRILAQGDPESIFYTYVSFRMLKIPLSMEPDWLTPLSETLLVENPNILETEGRIRACWLWLVLEQNASSALPLIRNRIGLQLEKWMSDVQNGRIMLDLPTWGALIEGHRRTGRFPTPIQKHIQDLYREPDGGYRLTPDCRVESMECLWWGTRLDRRYFGRNTQTCTILEEKVSSFQARNGGYGPRPGAIPDLTSTGMALDVLLTARKTSPSKRIF